MAILLRKVDNQANWIRYPDAFHLPVKVVSSDCWPTNDSLSMWSALTEFDIPRVAAALAATRDYLTNVDFLMTTDATLDDLDISRQQSPGETPYIVMNDHHMDVTSLTFGQLFCLCDEFQRCEKRRVPKSEIKAMLMYAIDTEQIDPHKLKSTLCRAVLGTA